MVQYIHVHVAHSSRPLLSLSLSPFLSLSLPLPLLSPYFLPYSFCLSLPPSTPGHNYHVTVPYQPMATYNEGLLQLSRSDSQITILPPTSSNPILDIPYSHIRRFGYQVLICVHVHVCANWDLFVWAAFYFTLTRGN